MYLCVIIDLWNRQVVGWSVRNDMTAQIVIDAFKMANFGMSALKNYFSTQSAAYSIVDQHSDQ